MNKESNRKAVSRNPRGERDDARGGAAERALRESEEKYRSLFMNSVDAIFLTAPDGKVLDANPAACAMLGMTKEEICLAGRDGIARQDAALAAAVKERARTGRIKAELTMVRKDGSQVPAEVTSVLISGKSVPPRTFVLARDISERKKAEEALRLSRDKLEERVRERTAELQQRAEQLSRLAAELTLAEQRERLRLAQVLHDHLQQLLIAAKLGLELLSRRVGEGLRSSVTEVQELLDESISATRSLTVELNPPILYEAGLPSSLEWLAHRKREKYGLAVDLDIDGPIQIEREEVKVLLFQATRELLLNVVKHAGVTSARVEVACIDGEHVRITVSDAGTGFDPEEMWGRASSVTAGFGLFSIRQRLEMLGGRLEVDSTPRKGSRFSLIAPMRRESKI